MSLLVIGMSHRSAPMSLLESVALSADQVRRLGESVVSGEHISEALVVATCNRLEVYASATAFHAAVAEVGEAIVDATGVPRTELSDHLYVHYEEGAVAHSFSLACGLDSMAVGETQILGQMRDALNEGQHRGQVGPELNSLFQQALRVGKRAHAETDIDRMSVSLVEAGLDQARRVLDRSEHAITSRPVLVVGAGSMSSLSASSLVKAGFTDIHVVNRTAEHGRRLAEAVGGVEHAMDELPELLTRCDLVVTCTGAVGHVVPAALVARAQERRDHAPAVYLDLALPRDVEAQAADIPGVTVVGLEELGAVLGRQDTSRDVVRVGRLVAEEVESYLAARRTAEVAPTVAALRARAAQVMSAELSRLAGRLPELTPQQSAEVRLTVHRVVEKLLHTPTVRVKQLAGDEQGDYARALRELFDLDPSDVAAISANAETAVGYR